VMALIFAPGKGLSSCKKKQGNWHSLRSRMGTQGQFQKAWENFGLFCLRNAGKGKGPAKLLFCGGARPSKHHRRHPGSLQKVWWPVRWA